MTRVNIEIPEEVHKKAKIVCAVQGITMKDYLVKALEEKLSKEKQHL